MINEHKKCKNWLLGGTSEKMPGAIDKNSSRYFVLLRQSWRKEKGWNENTFLTSFLKVEQFFSTHSVVHPAIPSPGQPAAGVGCCRRGTCCRPAGGPTSPPHRTAETSLWLQHSYISEPQLQLWLPGGEEAAPCPAKWGLLGVTRSISPISRPEPWCTQLYREHSFPATPQNCTAMDKQDEWKTLGKQNKIYIPEQAQSKILEDGAHNTSITLFLCILKSLKSWNFS